MAKVGFVLHIMAKGGRTAALYRPNRFRTVFFPDSRLLSTKRVTFRDML